MISFKIFFLNQTKFLPILYLALEPINLFELYWNNSKTIWFQAHVK